MCLWYSPTPCPQPSPCSPDPLNSDPDPYPLTLASLTLTPSPSLGAAQNLSPLTLSNPLILTLSLTLTPPSNAGAVQNLCTDMNYVAHLQSSGATTRLQARLLPPMLYYHRHTPITLLLLPVQTYMDMVVAATKPNNTTVRED